MIGRERAFGIVSADESSWRAAGEDLVGLFAVYQTCPRIMTHASRGFRHVADVSATAAHGDAAGAPYADFLIRRWYGEDADRAVAGREHLAFLATRFFSAVLCPSEPILARAGGRPAGILSPTPVTIRTHRPGDQRRTWRNRDAVERMVRAVRGWMSYLPSRRGNALMRSLIKTMDDERLPRARRAGDAHLDPRDRSARLGLHDQDRGRRWPTTGGPEVIDRPARRMLRRSAPRMKAG